MSGMGLSLDGPMRKPTDRPNAIGGPGETAASNDVTDRLGPVIDDSRARDELTASLARMAASADRARRRIVRDLRDGTQQRVVNTIITLKLAGQAHDHGDEEAVRDLLDQALDQAEHADAELRELVHGILPGVLARCGLAAGVEELVSSMRMPVHLDLAGAWVAPEIEENAYFVIAEAPDQRG